MSDVWAVPDDPTLIVDVFMSGIPTDGKAVADSVTVSRTRQTPPNVTMTLRPPTGAGHSNHVKRSDVH